MQSDDLRRILDSVNDAIFVHGIDGHIIDVNRKMLEMYRLGREQALALSIKGDFSGPGTDLGMLDELWAKALRGESSTFEWRTRRPGDGSLFDAEVCLHRVTLRHGDAIIATVHDITAIKAKELALEHAQELSHVGSWEVDQQGVSHWSDECFRIMGLQPRSRQPSFALMKSFIHPAEKDRVVETIASYRAGQTAYSIEFRIVTAGGKIRHICTEAQAILDSSGKPVQWYGIFQDISEEKIAGQLLKDRDDLFSAILEQADMGIATFDLSGYYLQVNQVMAEILGYSRAELLEMNYRKTTYADDLAGQDVLIRALLSDEIPHCKLNKRYVRKDGTIIWAGIKIFLARNVDGSPKYFIGIIEDITEQKLSADRINNSLKEKDVLLKEVNHRVKNHLQIISSLLSLQSAYIKDTDDLAIFRETQNSIRSMALIHEEIYASGNLREINLTEYLQVLAGHLIQSFTISDRVRLHFDMDNVYLPVEKAVPCGLIVNELVTNCMKYAFPGDRQGKITIGLYLKDLLTLTVRDNGVGFQKQADPKNSGSLGMQIIDSLTEQLGGSVEIEQGEGTAFRITMPV